MAKVQFKDQTYVSSAYSIFTFMILSLILKKPNVLLLDGPTNHLDFLTLEAFEAALLNFQGAILAVSHEEMFIEKIATQEWVLGSGFWK